MKKKALAIILTLVLVLGISSVAYAAESGVGTTVENGIPVVIITDPDPYDLNEPLNPADPDGDTLGDFNLSGSRLSFGALTPRMTEQVITTELPANRLGFLVYGTCLLNPQEGVRITGQVREFRHGDTASVVLRNFTLTLTPYAPDITAINGSVATVSMSPASNGGFGTPSAPIVTTDRKMAAVGGNFNGTLTVPGGAIQRLSNDATTVILWTQAPNI